MLDLLEQRMLLSTVTIFEHKLRIGGTSGNDSVAVARFGKSQGQVIENGSVALTFDLIDIKFISFAGFGGNDLITIGHVPIRSFLNGGNGNDSLSASRGNLADQLFGGAGNDYLFGGGGSDELTGNAGADTMFAGAGDDVVNILSDSVSDDVVSGGVGSDRVDASAYPDDVLLQIGNVDPNIDITDDTIFGDVEIILGTAFADDISVVSGRPVYIDAGSGNDTVTTGRGNDTIIGGAGRDLLRAAGGNDTIYGLDSEIDTLSGGSGDDTADADASDVLNSVTKV